MPLKKRVFQRHSYELVPLCVRARPEQSVEMSVTDYELQGLGQSAKNAFRAVQDGDLATLKRFLGSVDINIARNTRGRTLLHVACLSDDRLVVAELLRAGADPCACDEVNGSTPLHLTVFRPTRRRITLASSPRLSQSLPASPPTTFLSSSTSGHM